MEKAFKMNRIFLVGDVLLNDEEGDEFIGSETHRGTLIRRIQADERSKSTFPRRVSELITGGSDFFYPPELSKITALSRGIYQHRFYLEFLDGFRVRGTFSEMGELESWLVREEINALLKNYPCFNFNDVSELQAAITQRFKEAYLALLMGNAQVRARMIFETAKKSDTILIPENLAELSPKGEVDLILSMTDKTFFEWGIDRYMRSGGLKELDGSIL